MKYRLIVLLGVLGVSFSAIFVKWATAPSTVLAFFRMFFVTLLLSPVIFTRHRQELNELHRKEVILCLVSGFFLACHFSCYFESVHQTSVASSTVLVDTEVFFVAIASLLIFHENSSKIGWLGILITFGGSVILALSDGRGGGGSLYGDLLALAGALFVSIYTMIGSRVRKQLSNTLYTFFVYGGACVTLFFINLISGQKLTGWDGRNYLLGFLLAVVCTLMGHSIFNWALKYLPSTLISNVKLGEPVFATVLAVFLFGQRPSFIQILGMTVVMGGIFLYLTFSQGNRT